VRSRRSACDLVRLGENEVIGMISAFSGIICTPMIRMMNARFP
jgi:hypothetical protein